MTTRVLFLVFLTFSLLSCNIPSRDSGGKNSAVPYQKPPEFRGKPVEEHQGIASKGVIISDHDIPIYARVSALVEKAQVKEGMKVKKGQELVLFDSREMDINVKLAQNQLDQARFQYQTILVGQGYVPEKESDIPENIRKAARVRSSVELNESRLENAKLQLSYCTVTAPMDGVVTDVDVHQYDFIKAGAPLFHIIDTDHFMVEFFVLETDLKYFRQGTEILVHPIAEEERTITAEVHTIGQKVNESGMVKIRAKLSITEGLLVGMGVLVSL